MYIEVRHDDREIEFIQFKRWLESLYSEIDGGIIGVNTVLDLNNKSCEMIAEQLYKFIAVKYPERSVAIEVSEDNENGCLLGWSA